MTQITWKNGGPIFLAEDGAPGLVAASSNCCCPPPPPPGCWCPDWCLYQIEIVSPVAFSKRPSIPCNAASESLSREVILEDGLYGPCEDSAGCCGSISEPPLGLVGPVPHTASSYIDGSFASFVYLSNLNARAEVSVRFGCRNDLEPGVTYAAVSLRIEVPYSAYGDEKTGIDQPYRILAKYSSFAVDSTCALRTGATCDPTQNVRLAFLDVPLEFSVSEASAGLGSWDESNTFEGTNGDQDRITECFDHLVDNFEVTFRVTARESCQVVPLCCCEDGNVISEVSSSEECDGEVFAKPAAPKDASLVSVIVDWDGLTVELSSANGFNAAQVSEDIDTFECVQPGDYVIQADKRYLQALATSYGSNSCNLWAFSVQIYLQFEGVGPFLGRVGSAIYLGASVSECHDGSVSPFPAPGTDPSWCPNDYPSPTVTLVIAP